jgi:hypothetical protein
VPLLKIAIEDTEDIEFILGVLYGEFHPNVGERKFMGNSLVKHYSIAIPNSQFAICNS